MTRKTSTAKTPPLKFTVFYRPSGKPDEQWLLFSDCEHCAKGGHMDRETAEREARAFAENYCDAIVNDSNGKQVYEVHGIPGRAHRAGRVNVKALEVALCTLADHEGLVSDALADAGMQRNEVNHVCHALRRIVDDGFRSAEVRGGS